MRTIWKTIHRDSMRLSFLIFIFFPCFVFSQDLEKKAMFEAYIQRLNLYYSIPKGFKEIDTPKSYKVLDTSHSFRFTKMRTIDVWLERLKCQDGINPGVVLFRVMNKEENLIISYTIHPYSDFRKSPGSYESQLKVYENDDTRKVSFIKFRDTFVQKKYGASDGGILEYNCNCNLKGFSNLKILYLTKRPKEKIAGNADVGSAVSVIFQYTSEMDREIDKIIAETSKSLRYLNQ